MSCYHEKNQNEDILQTTTPTPEIRSRKQSVSDKKVTFSVSDDVETAVEPDYQDEGEVNKFPIICLIFLVFCFLVNCFDHQNPKINSV